MSVFDAFRSLGQLSSGFWSGPNWRRAWLLTIGAFALALIDVGMQVALNRWNKGFYDSLEKKSLEGLGSSAVLFLVLVVAATTTVVLAQLARILLQIRWREHLTDRTLGLWLNNQAYYRLNVMRGADFAPEARIAEDLRISVEPVVDLVLGFLTAAVTFVAFVGILWTVGGSLEFAGATVAGVTLPAMTIPGFMVFAAVLYAGLVSILMMIVGNSFADRYRERSEAEAQFRYELTRLRENAESVALVRGEDGERRSLFARYGTVVDKWYQYAYRWSYMTVVVHSSNLAAPVIPVLLMAPKYLSGEATLGTVMQAATAFGTVQASLGWITANFARLSEWYASASRVAELNAYIQAASKPGEETNRIEIKSNEGTRLLLNNVAVRLHTGKTLVADADLDAEPGESVLVTGKSGTGKSILVRAIAGLWPWGGGTILLPKDSEVAFVSQRPYLPIGTLRTVLTYPRAPDGVPAETLKVALSKCGLDGFASRLDEHAAWDRVLSGGEQQRLALARLLVQRPGVVILDEAMSALDDASQATMMELFKAELPESMLISVTNRPHLARYHTRQITLVKREAGSFTGRDDSGPGGEAKKPSRWGRLKAVIGKVRRGKQSRDEKAAGAGAVAAGTVPPVAADALPQVSLADAGPAAPPAGGAEKS